MARGLTVLIVLLSCGVCRGGLLTNFAASYALYQQCTMNAADFDIDADIDGIDLLMWQRGLATTGMFITPYGDADRNGNVNQVDKSLWQGQYATNMGISDSVCFKLYLDPQGVIAGRVTVVIDVPNPVGQVRLELGSETGIVDVHPQYTAQLVQANIIPLPNRQRLEAVVSFAAINPANPPSGPITIFGFQAHDNLPQLGFAGSQVGFDFRTGDSITVFDTSTNQATSFNDTQLNDVVLQVNSPLVLNVNTATGAVSVRSTSSVVTQINFYEIKSVSGALNVNGWVSIDDTESDPPGISWDESSNVSSKLLSETNSTTSLSLSNGELQNLGHAYNELSGLRDLTFTYRSPTGSLIPGRIVYEAPGPAAPAPEPSGAGLTLAGLIGIAACRRRAG